MPTRVGRLRQRSQFLRVAAARNKWVTPGLILQARTQALNGADLRLAPDDADLRVGFTTSKKVGNAVARNRARRRLRAAVHDLFDRHARSGMDYVLIGRRSTLDRPWNRLLQDLQQAMVKLDTWCDETQTTVRAKTGQVG
ncbi:MAG: ribonuclease P protein component [Alphaproteobacteria bacterium]|jgi:ribonuclease P protein component|nr:ribonuclease P protein component [Alphaproteobacteria bacterium]MBT4020657.1 ribonuclease P protein component [Alphaproteobacteria bacterium]MBT4965328.1 ribonuclease P protein component [Alphaproteobacteria bacterium]MBT5161356.1 ribonuclease P protein component [Alphaproteobacteria bacterium]MBT5918205.1 ribonuclease P protein component [Alphaproteobacteria bacterium]